MNLNDTPDNGDMESLGLSLFDLARSDEPAVDLELAVAARNEIYNSLISDIQQWIGNQIAECRGCVGECVDCIAGNIGLQTAAVDKVITSIGNALIKNLNDISQLPGAYINSIFQDLITAGAITPDEINTIAGITGELPLTPEQLQEAIDRGTKLGEQAYESTKNGTISGGLDSTIAPGIVSQVTIGSSGIGETISDEITVPTTFAEAKKKIPTDFPILTPFPPGIPPAPPGSCYSNWTTQPTSNPAVSGFYCWKVDNTGKLISEGYSLTTPPFDPTGQTYCIPAYKTLLSGPECSGQQPPNNPPITQPPGGVIPPDTVVTAGNLCDLVDKLCNGKTPPTDEPDTPDTKTPPTETPGEETATDKLFSEWQWICLDEKVQTTTAEQTSPISLESAVNALQQPFADGIDASMDTLDVPYGFGWVKSLVGGIAKLIFGFVAVFLGLGVKLGIRPNSCNGGSYELAVIRHTFTRIFNLFFSIVPTVVVKAAEQDVNKLCPTGIPDSGTISLLRSKGQLDENLWTDGVKRNGDCPEWFTLVTDASYQIPNIPTVFGLWRSELLTEENAKFYLSRNGVTLDRDYEIWSKASESLPGPSDLIRLMVRDVADPEVVESQQLGTDFEKKWAGLLKQYGDRQNIDPETAKLLWYGHWVYPAFGQAVECYHRLRPELGLTTPDGKPLQVTLDDIRELAKINDMAPAWIDRMIAIASPVLGRIDIRRAWRVGALKDEQLIPAYRDLGYTEENAKIFADFTIKTESAGRAKLIGKPTPQELRKAYLDSLIDDEALQQGLLDTGLTPEFIPDYVSTIKSLRSIADTKAVIAQLRKGYMGGRYSDNEYSDELIRAGVSAERSNEIVHRDSQIRKARYKEFTLAKLCGMVQRGFLGADEYLKRAQNLGYTYDNASLLMRSCMADIAEKLKAQIEKDMAKAEKARRAAESAADRARKKAREDYLESLPCKPAPKPTCPAGVSDTRV